MRLFRRAGGASTLDLLVAGLGNPGREHSGNRHNVGAMVADRMAAGLGLRFSTHCSRAEVTEGRLPPAAGTPGTPSTAQSTTSGCSSATCAGTMNVAEMSCLSRRA